MKEQTGKSVDDSASRLAQDVTLISLKESLDIWQNIDLQDELLAALRAATPVAIKGDKVERVDAVAVQLLAGFFLAMEKEDVECRWEGISNDLRQAISCCGLDVQLGLVA